MPKCPSCGADDIYIGETTWQVPQYKNVEMVTGQRFEIRVQNDIEVKRWAHCTTCDFRINDVDEWVKRVYNDPNFY